MSATPLASRLIRLHANDNVLVVRQAQALGRELPEFGLRCKAQVPTGHKTFAQHRAKEQRASAADWATASP